MAEDLSKRGKVKGQYRSGGYKKQRAKGRQVSGLTKKQVAAGRRVGKAGRSKVTKKEAKASYKNIDISQTRWKSAGERTGPRAKGGIVVDKSGKPITGTVKLASGKTATYVRGKRVTYKAKPAGGGGGGGGTSASRPKPTTTRVPPSMRQEGAGGTQKPKPKTVFVGANKPLTKGEPPMRVQSKSRPRPGTTTKTPKVGDIRKVPFGNTGRSKRQRWDGKKWVTINRFD